MNKKYQMWDEVSPVITPNMKVFTPEEWMDKYPAAKLDGLNLVISGGKINGSFCTEYTSFVDMYEKMGCDFTGCTTQQEHLDTIEAFEDEMNKPNEEETVTAEERIAAALEAQVMMALPDEESEVI